MGPTAPTTSRVDRWGGTIFLVGAAVALGLALQVNDGSYHRRALAWLAVAIVCAVAATLAPRLDWLERWGESLVVGSLGVGLALQFWKLLSRPPAQDLRVSPAEEWPFTWGLALAVVLSAALLRGGPRAVPFLVGALIALCGLLGLWILRASPDPPIDVLTFHREAAGALLRGDNPYALRMPNIYEDASPFYPPGYSADGRLTIGYVYLPLSLLLVVPGYLLGDVRYSQLAAMLGAAALMAYARPTRVSALAAALFLLTPRGFYILGMGWTEPFVLLLFAAALACALRRPAALPWALGLFVAVKQYLVLALPAMLLLVPGGGSARRTVRLGLVVAVAALVVTLPLAALDPRAFVRSAVTMWYYQPQRDDALSYLVAVALRTGSTPSPLWSLPAAAAGFALGVWRAPRTAAGLATTVALGFLLFFAFNKLAFANYYYFVLGALCLAIALARPRR